MNGSHLSWATAVNPPADDPDYLDELGRWADAKSAELEGIEPPGLTAHDGSPIPEPDVRFGPRETAELMSRVLEPAAPRYRFTGDHGIYRAEWPALGVLVELDQVKRERSGDVTAEASVRVNAQHVHTARVTLTGTRSRQEFAKHVRSRAGNAREADWDGIVEAASVRTIEAHREGEPAILLRDAPQPMDDGYLVGPIAHARLPVVLFGDGGAGKSQLALAIAASIQSGREYAGLPVSGTRTVGYLDWEMSAWEHRQRLHALTGDDMPGIVYVPCSAPLPESVDRLRRIARDHGIGYWIVDSVAPACGGEPESAEVASAYFNALRALGGASLSVAHVTKGGDGADLKPFGSTFWHNLARATWYAKGSEDEDTLSVGLYQRKNNTGRRSEPLAFRMAFGPGSLAITRTDVGNVPDLARKLPLGDRIRPLVRSGALTLHELAEELDASLEAVRLACKRGQTRGFLQAVHGPDGVERWGLAA